MNIFDFGDEPNQASTADSAFYQKYGYLVAQGMFSAAECEKLNMRAEDHANRDFAATQNLHRLDPAFLQFLRFSRLVSFLETLRPQTLMGLGLQMLYKKAGSPYAAQAWSPHQDNSYIQNPNNLYITINLFLSDADPENGGIYVYPGSHVAGLLSFERRTSFREKPGAAPGNLITEIPTEYDRLDLSVKQGDLLIMNGCLVHGSYPNISAKRSRPLLSGTYLPVGEYFLPGRTAKREPVELHDY